MDEAGAPSRTRTAPGSCRHAMRPGPDRPPDARGRRTDHRTRANSAGDGARPIVWRTRLLPPGGRIRRPEIPGKVRGAAFAMGSPARAMSLDRRVKLVLGHRPAPPLEVEGCQPRDPSLPGQTYPPQDVDLLVDDPNEVGTCAPETGRQRPRRQAHAPRITGSRLPGPAHEGVSARSGLRSNQAPRSTRSHLLSVPGPARSLPDRAGIHPASCSGAAVSRA